MRCTFPFFRKTPTPPRGEAGTSTVDSLDVERMEEIYLRVKTMVYLANGLIFWTKFDNFTGHFS